MVTYLCFYAQSDEDVRPRTTIQVENFGLVALFDTGCSVTLLNWKTFLKIRNKAMRLKPCDSTLRTASGTSMKIRGQVVLRFGFGKHSCLRPTIVVDGLKTGCIVGADTMSSEGIVVDPARRKICIVPLKYKLSVHSTKEILIPARQTRVIKGSMKNFMSVIGRDALFFGQVTNDLDVDSSLHNISSDGILHMSVTNHQDCDVLVARGRFLGTLEPNSGNEQYRVEEIRPDHQPTRGTADAKLEDLDMSNIPGPFQPMYRALLQRFKDVFSLNPDDIGKCKVIQHKIVLKDPTKILSVPPYRIPHNLLM